MEPVKNLTFQTGFSYRTLVSASPEFKLDYYITKPDALGNGGIIRADLNQSEVNFQIDYTPGRKTVGYAVERQIVSSPYPRFFINYSVGIKGFLDSDFEYKKRIINRWISAFESGNLSFSKETQIDLTFLNDIFGEVLGYDYEIDKKHISLIPKSSIKLIHVSKRATLFSSSNGFGVSNVIGFNLLPKPAHKIKAVSIFILPT